FARMAQVRDSGGSTAALDHRHALLRAIGGDIRPRAARDVVARHTHANPQAREVEAVLHLSSSPGYTSPWWLLGLLELPAPWRLSVRRTTHHTSRDSSGV